MLWTARTSQYSHRVETMQNYFEAARGIFRSTCRQSRQLTSHSPMWFPDGKDLLTMPPSLITADSAPGLKLENSDKGIFLVMLDTPVGHIYSLQCQWLTLQLNSGTTAHMPDKKCCRQSFWSSQDAILLLAPWTA